MPVQNVLKAISAEALFGIFMEAHDVSKEHSPGFLSAAEIPLRVAVILV